MSLHICASVWCTHFLFLVFPSLNWSKLQCARWGDRCSSLRLRMIFKSPITRPRLARSRNDVRIVGVSNLFAREDEQKVYHGEQRTGRTRVPAMTRDARFRRKSIQKTLPHASLSSLRARSIFPEHCFPRAISRAAFAVSGRERGARARRAFSLSLAFARSPSLALPCSFSSRALPLVGSRGTTTGRVPEIIVRIDPRATRTGWIYSRARGERRRERGKEGLSERASVLRYLIVPCSKWGPSQRPCRRGCRHVRFSKLERKWNMQATRGNENSQW